MPGEEKPKKILWKNRENIYKIVYDTMDIAHLISYLSLSAVALSSLNSTDILFYSDLNHFIITPTRSTYYKSSCLVVTQDDKK